MATSNMAACGHFGFPILSNIDRVLLLWVINGCVKYEFDTRIGVAVMRTQALACGGGGGCGDGVRTKTIISPKFQISGILLYVAIYGCVGDIITACVFITT